MKPKAKTAKLGMDSRIPTTRQIPTRITKAKTQLAMNPTTGIKRKNENLAPGPNVAKTVKKLSPSKVYESVANLTKPATTLGKSKQVPVAREPLSSRARTGLELNGTRAVVNKTVTGRTGLTSNKPATATTSKKQIPPNNAETKAKAPAPKRIPPYDFKARFHDLLEKHQVLKKKHETLREELGELADLPERYDQTKDELNQALVKVQALTEEKDGLLMKNESLVSTLTETKEALRILEEKCPQLEAVVRELTDNCKNLANENMQLTGQNDELSKTAGELNQEMERCAEQLYRANYERKELHNMVSPVPFY